MNNNQNIANVQLKPNYYFHDIGITGEESIKKTIERKVHPHTIEKIKTSHNYWGLPSGAESIFRNLKQNDIIFLGRIQSDTDGEVLYACKIGFINKHLSDEKRKSLAKELWGSDKYELIFSCEPVKLQNLTYVEFSQFTGHKQEPGRIAKCPSNNHAEEIIKRFS